MWAAGTNYDPLAACVGGIDLDTWLVKLDVGIVIGYMLTKLSEYIELEGLASSNIGASLPT